MHLKIVYTFLVRSAPPTVAYTQTPVCADTKTEHQLSRLPDI